MKSVLLVSTLCALLLLAACGIKPRDVDPPQGAEHDTYPQVYPAPEPQY